MTRAPIHSIARFTDKASLRILLTAPLIAAVACSGGERTEAVSQTEAASPSHYAPEGDVAPEPEALAAALTQSSVFEAEEFWPYHVRLREAWNSPELGRELKAGSKGVLTRLERGDDGNLLARIAIARTVIFVPLEMTDVVDAANRIRAGELSKLAPNFVLTIGPRLMDGNAMRSKMIGVDESRTIPGFLAVFADPGSDDFAAIADSMRPLANRYGVATVLFPQGEYPDPDVLTLLHQREWSAHYILDFLSEAYTRTIVAEPVYPRVALLSQEGRLYFEEEWSPAVGDRVSSALDRAFGPTRSANESGAWRGDPRRRQVARDPVENEARGGSPSAS